MGSHKPVERVGLVVHGGRRGALEATEKLSAWLRDRGVKTCSLEGEAPQADEERPSDSFGDGLDLVISVGGDGTLLRAALLANRNDVPLLGVKVGRLGFLTEVEPEDAPDLLAEVLEGAMRIEERMALVARPIGAPWTEPQWALNEVIVEKTARHRLITL